MNHSFPTFRGIGSSRPYGLAWAHPPHLPRVFMGGLLSVILCGGLVGWFSPSAQAATFGPLADGDVTGLIDAIDAANANGEADTILLATNGTYTLSSTADARIPFGSTGLPSIVSEMMIQGNGAVIERDANLFTNPDDPCSSLETDQFRILFQERAMGPLTLDNVTIQNGCGGGITNLGPLTLMHSTVRNNESSRFAGVLGGDGQASVLRLIDSTVTGNKGGISLPVISGTFNTAILIDSTVSHNTGAGIHSNRGFIRITRSFVHDNRGGGVSANRGGMSVTHSTVRDNGGAGIFAFESGVTVIHTTVSGNANGGISVSGSSTTMLTNSTVSGNTKMSGSIGSGISNDGSSVTLTNSTVTNNSAEGREAVGIWTELGSVNLTNSIVANQTSGVDCLISSAGGRFVSDDFNLDSDDTCNLTQSHDKPNGNASLGLLQVNAPGTTATHALAPFSDAVDMGDCSGGTVAEDQRGVARPQGAACDIGAYELVQSFACTPATDPDLNNDGVVNILDVGRVASCVGQDPTNLARCQLMDINCDGDIDVTDVSFVTSSVGQDDF